MPQKQPKPPQKTAFWGVFESGLGISVDIWRDGLERGAEGVLKRADDVEAGVIFGREKWDEILVVFGWILVEFFGFFMEMDFCCCGEGFVTWRDSLGGLNIIKELYRNGSCFWTDERDSHEKWSNGFLLWFIFFSTSSKIRKNKSKFEKKNFFSELNQPF